MRRITTYTTVALASILLISGCSTKAPEAHHKATQATDEAHHAKHWGYSADVAPSHWSMLDKKFHICSEGHQQSPINIDESKGKDVKLPPLAINYASGSKSIINNGHTIQVNIQDGDTLKINGEEYTLKQFHFHTPSENHINGESFPLEAHFVHTTKDGKLAVIAVMFKEGTANPTLGKIIKEFPLEHNKEQTLKFSKAYLDVVMPTNRDYYHFMGSLTTPPCSEEVNWFVLKTPQTATAEQIAKIHQEIGMNNNRPIQPVNGRVIEE
jgi:carbonic anhydrase